MRTGIRRKFFLTITMVYVIGVTACSVSKDVQQKHSLKNAFQHDFLIGTALDSSQIVESNKKVDLLIKKQFNAITAENVMKTAIIHPKADRYNFSLADKFVAYGKKHNMYLVGHTLIWHSQLAPFVEKIASPEALRAFMTAHIKTIAGRYAGSINAWDVVNEALNEDGSFRNSVFYQKLGENYLTESFRIAQQAAPAAELYYNDYNIEQPAKRAGCIQLIKKIQSAGLRIDGVGIQGHWLSGKVPLEAIEQSILEYSALGIQVAITELDLEMLPRNFQGADLEHKMKTDSTQNPYTKGLPENKEQQLAKDYEDLFRLFLKHKDKISRVTFWGVEDGQSWLNNWPMPGRTNYPLLFDRKLKPKAAYFRLLDLKN